MLPYNHGGDGWDYDRPLLDFSANLNPLGMPPKVAAAARAAVSDAVRYPDPRCRALAAALAARDGVGPEEVLCGGGAADLIFRLVYALRPRRALVTAPTFSEYEGALRAAGCQVSDHLLRREEDFDVTAALLEDLAGVDLLFLCTPNNPTGRTVPPGVMEAVLDRCRDLGIALAVDECFLELTTGGGAGLAPLLSAFPNLTLLRAFTKSYAIPGLRLGYCLSADTGLLERMAAAGPPWAVSAPAQAAGLAAAARPDWPGKARLLLEEERPRLARALAGLGFSVVPGQANYLLFQAPGVEDLKERLIPGGVLLRACASYRGLGPDWYRTAVRTRAENDILFQRLKEVL